MRAFAGESQARNRYTFAAAKAKENNLHVIEAVFTFTANQEKEHAEIFYDYLKYSSGSTIYIDGGYPVDIYEQQFAKLCSRWERGLEMLRDVPPCETTVMAHAAYCLFKSSLDQIRFYRAREIGDRETMLSCAREEEKTARKMLELMNMDASIGYEAANHYYFSKGQIAEKIVNCQYVIRQLTRP